MKSRQQPEHSAVSAAVQSASVSPIGHVLIDIDAVKTKMGWKSDSTVYQYVSDRGFPRPKKGSRRNARWLLAQVDAYIEAMPEGAAGDNPAKKAAA